MRPGEGPSRPRVARAQKKIISPHPLLLYFIFQGSLVDPRSRASNESRLILFFSPLVKGEAEAALYCAHRPWKRLSVDFLFPVLGNRF